MQSSDVYVDGELLVFAGQIFKKEKCCDSLTNE